MKFTAAALSALVASQAAAQHFEIRIGNAEIFNENSDPDDILAALEKHTSSNDGPKWKTDCTLKSTFEGSIYAVRDPAHAPKDIAWAMSFLDEFWKTDRGGDLPYPGDFDRFMHRDGFRVIRTEYKNLPWAVRKHREDLLAEGKKQQRKYIAELDGVAFFAPGVVKRWVPLFAAKDAVPGEDSCHDDLVNLDNFEEFPYEGTRFYSSIESIAQVDDKVVVEVMAMRETLSDGTETGADRVTDADVGDL